MQPVTVVLDTDLSPAPLISKYMSQAKAYTPFVEAYNGLVQQLTKGQSLPECIATLTGVNDVQTSSWVGSHSTPHALGPTRLRRLVTTGIHAGGALATLAAPPCQLQWPSANVRCLTFGSPRVGTRALAHAVQWLCQASYRTVLPADPWPEEVLPAQGGLVHADQVILLGHQDFANDTMRRRMRTGASKQPPDAALAEDAAAMGAYAHALDLAQLVPQPIKGQLVDKALAVRCACGGR